MGFYGGFQDFLMWPGGYCVYQECSGFKSWPIHYLFNNQLKPKLLKLCSNVSLINTECSEPRI